MHGDDMAETLARQRAAFMAALPVTLDTRRDRLRRLAAMVSDHTDRLVSAMAQDFGHRSREQSLITDIGASVAAVQHAIASLARWSRPEKRRTQFPLGLLGARAWVEYQPKGVVGVIAPWNFPVYLAVGPIAGAFAAGNRAMLKPSETTPATSALFEEIVPQHFDRTELAVVTGGPDVGAAFAGLPFDHLIFTGATAVARHILHAAADNLVPVTLELGGKSPTIVGRSADLAVASERIVAGKMLNAGQVCLAPDYALVPDERETAFVEAIRSAATRLYPTWLGNDDYSSVVNERHRVRLEGVLDDARAKGGEVVAIDPAGEMSAATNSNKLPLHLVLNATDDMAVMRDEIFGPVLPVRRYGAIDDAIATINAGPRPLALYYFGSDAGERRHVLDRTISGGVTLDDVVFHAAIDDLPFGGVGASGMGSYHGIDGFRTFSHARAVYRQSRFDVAKLAGMKPPYGKATAATIARLMKR